MTTIFIFALRESSLTYIILEKKHKINGEILVDIK